MVDRIKKSIDVVFNFFTKDSGKNIQNVNRMLTQTANTMSKTTKNFGLSTAAINNLQKTFGLSVVKSGKSLKDMNGNLLSNSNQLNQYIARNATAGKMLGISRENLNKFNESGIRSQRVTARMTNRMRTLTQGTKGFRMELLGVMFFGMALQRVMSGLVKQSFEWVGVWDILGTALGLLFLPLALKIQKWALWFLDWVGTLTEDQKKLIGNIILTVAALGAFLFIVGTLGLGIGSLIEAFGFLFGKGLFANILKTGGLFKWLGALVAGISLPILIAAAIIIAVVIGIYLAWKSNFLKIRDNISKFVEAFKGFFNGIKNFVHGFLLILKGIFTGDFELVKIGIIKIFTGLWQILINGFKLAFQSIIIIVKGALKIVYNILKVIIDGVGWLVGKVGGLIGIGSGGSAFSLPSFQDGGIVPGSPGQAVPIIAHAGETVVPVGESRGIGNIFNTTINASIASDYDVKQLSDELQRQWTQDFERLAQGRTI